MELIIFALVLICVGLGWGIYRTQPAQQAEGKKALMFCSVDIRTNLVRPALSKDQALEGIYAMSPQDRDHFILCEIVTISNGPFIIDTEA